MSYIDTIIFDAGGHTGNEYYIRIVDDDTGNVWDAIAEEMVAPAVGVWADEAIELVEQGSTGQFPIVIPTDLPTGYRYNIVIYKIAGSEAANTDDIEKQMQVMRGSIFGF